VKRRPIAGFFYVNGEPRSAQALLARLDLDASADMGAARGRLEYKASEAPMSPALDQALFAMALLPLLRSDDDEPARDSIHALNAYARMSRE